MDNPETHMESGIYKIVNLINGKCYVGSAENLNSRKHVHWHSLRQNVHYNSHLQRSWNKYGEEALEFRIVGKCPVENLIRLEQEVMGHLKPEYNISPTAGSPLGVKHTPETRRKQSEAQKGKKLSVEHRRKIGVSQKGKKHQLFSAEARRNMSEARKGNQNAFGYKHTPEARRRIGEASRGRAPSDETRRKISEMQKSNQNALGHKHTPEARYKMSEARKAWWVAKRAVG